MTKATATATRAHWLVAEELREAHLAAGLAAEALGYALKRQAWAEEAATKWGQLGVPLDKVHDAADTSGKYGYRDCRLWRGPSPEELAAFEEASGYARNRLQALEEERKALGPFSPEAEARAAGCPWYAREHFSSAGVRYTPGQPVPRSALENLPAHKVRALTGRGGPLREVEV